MIVVSSAVCHPALRLHRVRRARRPAAHVDLLRRANRRRARRRVHRRAHCHVLVNRHALHHALVHRHVLRHAESDNVGMT